MITFQALNVLFVFYELFIAEQRHLRVIKKTKVSIYFDQEKQKFTSAAIIY